MDHNTLDVLALSAMHDTSIRSYYDYQLISELARAQKTGFLDTLGTVIGLFATTATIFGVLSYPQYGPLIGGSALAAFVVLTVVWIILRRRDKAAEVLSYGTYLGILMDELSKYSLQLKLIKSSSDKDADIAKLFSAQTERVLKASRQSFDEVANGLKAGSKYKDVLKQFGWDEKSMSAMLKDVDELLEGSNGVSKGT